ncbi:MAG: hypothetical protein KBD63_00185 [Bacteriovoracaceae bacterium]|nr:hypothetical protein [Bacteriovoracaceae bacterium]
MKTLVVSLKPTSQILDEAFERLSKIKTGEKITPHYELSFTDLDDFQKFISALDVLIAIKALKPKSIYELAELMQKDIGNMNRKINFLEKMGAIKTQKKIVNGRKVKVPVVHYSKIEFDLVA